MDNLKNHLKLKGMRQINKYNKDQNGKIFYINDNNNGNKSIKVGQSNNLHGKYSKQHGNHKDNN